MLAVAWPVILGHVLAAVPRPITLPSPYQLVSESQASGPPATNGDRVTVHVRVVNGGRVLVDTEARGLPFTFVIGESGVMPMVSDLALGLSTGSRRIAWVPAAVAAERASVLMPDGAPIDLKVQIRVLNVVK